MLRMGRGPKTEPARDDNRQPLVNQPPEIKPPDSRPVFQQPAASQPAAPDGKPAPTRALSESEALARDIKDGVVGGFVGKNADLIGEANFKGMLRIDGRFSGTVYSEDGTLIVSAGGVVEANIAVATARINGIVNGNIKATQRVEFGRSAQVRGDIHTPTLVIEQGAVFEGQCRMTSRAGAEDVATKKKALEIIFIWC
ncbi:MAG: polymer-forming cytoskeletal protein [Acidobacteria bacterium]|nr:polymer-forming cytoskeletal protein [Acidobacteriota bacterium]